MGLEMGLGRCGAGIIGDMPVGTTSETARRRFVERVVVSTLFMNGSSGRNDVERDNGRVGFGSYGTSVDCMNVA